MAVRLLIAGATGLVALLIAARGTQRRPKEAGQPIQEQEQPQITTAVVPKRYQVLETYLWDQEGGSSSSTFSLAGVMRRASWPFVRYRVHVLEPMQLTVVASVEGFVLGQQSGVQEPGFDPMRAMEITMPSTPGTYQLQVLFSGANYEESRSLSLTIVS